MNYQLRMQKMREKMRENGIDALFLPSSGDRQYLTGLPSERPNTTHHHRSGDWLDGLFVTQQTMLYTVPWMLRDRARLQIADKPQIEALLILEEGADHRGYASQVFRQLGLGKSPCFGLPKGTMGKTMINLRDVCPDVRFVNIEQYTWPMRMIKDGDEIALLRKASAIADRAFLETIKRIKPGIRECEVGYELAYQMQLLGSEGLSFPVDITATNPDGQMGGTSLMKIEKGANIAFDFGCVYDGYCSDTGRTIYLGEPAQLCRDVHALVMKAQQAALDALKAGQITAYGLDCAARKVINGGGYRDEFFHRLGHGIGIDVHEYPFLSKGYDEVLRENMLITVEPSILIPNKLRIRVEDVVRITSDGCELLNAVTKEMIILD